MEECVVLVDNSNVFIEARKLSAVRLGLPPAMPGKAPQDWNWRVDYGGLLTHLAEGRKIRKAFLVGSRPPPNDGVWNMAERCGFEVKTHDRDANNREKAVDTDLVAQGTRIICMTSPAVPVIASGDGDFIPLVDVAHEAGWMVEMAAFKSAFSPMGAMAMKVDRIRPLDDALDRIGDTTTGIWIGRGKIETRGSASAGASGGD